MSCDNSHYAFLLLQVALIMYVRGFIADYCGNVEKHFFRNATYEQKINVLKSRRLHMSKQKKISIYFCNIKYILSGAYFN